MKGTGVCKNIDDLGRVVIPKGIRKKLGLDCRSSVEIIVDGDSLIIRKAEKSCVFCGSDDGLTEFKNKSVCQECLKDIKR